MGGRGQRAKLVVGLDFGTTFSGFAYSHTDDPDRIHAHYDWPGQPQPYIKTQTSLFYEPNTQRESDADPEYVVRKWAWPAQEHFLRVMQGAHRARRVAATAPTPHDASSGPSVDIVQDVQHQLGFFVHRFKLDLVDGLATPDFGDLAKQQQVPAQPQPQPQPQAPALNRPKTKSGKGKPRSGLLCPWLLCGSGGNVEDAESESESESDQPPTAGVGIENQFRAPPTAGLGSGSGGGIDNQFLARDRDGGLEEDDGTTRLRHGLYTHLPPGVTVERAITDFLHNMADFIVQHLRASYPKAGKLDMADVQWCLTVPAIWDDKAKQKMRFCAQRAGMVRGPHCPPERAPMASPFDLIIVLESEAASIYCAKKSRQLDLAKGTHFLVADIGGGTADIVVHVKDNDEDSPLQVREVKHSVGGLCGGTFVDKGFVDFLSRTIGCFAEFATDHAGVVQKILKDWELPKRMFDGSLDFPLEFDLPTILADEWQKHDEKMLARDPAHEGKGKEVKVYHHVEISEQEMRGIFDPVVDQIIGLIRGQMSPQVQVILMVGGFSGSPYLLRRVKEAFEGHLRGPIIICPSDPGSAICQGAVLLGMSQNVIVSRVARKTYGISECRDFQQGDPHHLLDIVNGKRKCKDAFCVFVRVGQEIGIDECVQKERYPVYAGQKTVQLLLYSSTQSNPRYISDAGVKLEGTLTMDISEDLGRLDTRRCILVSLYFGRSYIQVKAQRKNFGNTSEVLEMSEYIQFSSQEATSS